MPEPIEIRSEADDAPDLAAAVAAVEDIRSAVETGRAEIEQRMSGHIDALTKRIDAIDLRSQRPGAQDTKDDAIERRAFASFLRSGREAMAADEVRALRVGDDMAGGYLAPPEFVTEILKGLVQTSPLRSLASVRTTSAASIIRPVRTGRPTASWVGEVEDRAATESAYGQAETPVHEMACFVDVSQQLLEDSAVNVEAEVASDLAEEFGRLEAVSFLDGDGVKKPLGLLNVPGVATTPSGAAAALNDADALINLFYALPQPYRQNGSWLLNGSTLATIRKLKDGHGNYLWQPGLAAGQPETILGRPVTEAIDMPEIAAGETPVIFGDFAKAYQIVDRVSFSILRDPYSVATKGLVRFHARRRVGGGGLLAEAVRKLRIAAS